MQGKALGQGNSAFVDSNWNAYPNQWEILLNKPKLSQEFIELKIKEWSDSVEYIEDDADKREKQRKKKTSFSSLDVDGKLDITLANGIYIDSTNITVAMQNKIRRMAAISNPVYFKNQAIGTWNYDTSRWIYLGQDDLSGYIQIPRGLYGTLISKLEQANIKYKIND